MLGIDNLELPVCRVRDAVGRERRMQLTTFKSTSLQSIQQFQQRPDETLELSTLGGEGGERRGGGGINHY